MKYRRLGKTSLRVSVVGLGAWQFGGAWGKDFTPGEVATILDEAHAWGINLIDTAECYGPHLSEKLIGTYLKERGGRHDWVLATKFGHRWGAGDDGVDYWSAAAVRQELEESLGALQTDYIDLYQFHSGIDQIFDNEELWTMLIQQVQTGKVRHLGISIGSNDNLYQTQSAAKVGADVIQVVFNRLDRRADERVLPECRRQDLGVLARVPLASGYLSGKYRHGTTFPANDVRSRHDPQRTTRMLDEVERIAAHEVPAGVEMATWALAWCLRNPAVTTVIPGCKSPEQVASNARAADMDLAWRDHPQAWPD